MPKQGLVEVLESVFKTYVVAEIETLVQDQVNRRGSLFLQTIFPSKSEFYGQVICRSRKRVTEDDIIYFLQRRKGRPRLPSFLITSIGYTDPARALAKKKGIQLLTYSEIAQYLRLLDLPPAEWRDHNINFLH